MESIKVILSKKFSLLGRDYWRGALIAAGTAIFTTIGTVIENGSFVFNWTQIAISGIAAGAFYLFKNGVIEPTKVITEVPSTEQMPAEDVKTEIKKLVS